MFAELVFICEIAKSVFLGSPRRDPVRILTQESARLDPVRLLGQKSASTDLIVLVSGHISGYSTNSNVKAHTGPKFGMSDKSCISNC